MPSAEYFHAPYQSTAKCLGCGAGYTLPNFSFSLRGAPASLRNTSPALESPGGVTWRWKLRLAEVTVAKRWVRHQHSASRRGRAIVTVRRRRELMHDVRLQLEPATPASRRARPRVKMPTHQQSLGEPLASTRSGGWGGWGLSKPLICSEGHSLQLQDAHTHKKKKNEKARLPATKPKCG